MKKLSLLVFVLLFLLSACGTSTPAATQAPVQQNTAEPAPVVVEPSVTTAPVAVAAVFQVVKADGTTFDVTLAALKNLPLASITVDGKVQEGPKLMDVLKLAGVTDFAEVTLTGSASPATLTREQVDNNTILDFNNHGTLKLATTYIPMPDWTKDVAVITVK